MRAGRVIMLENSEFNMHMYVLYRYKMEDVK